MGRPSPASPANLRSRTVGSRSVASAPAESSAVGSGAEIGGGVSPLMRETALRWCSGPPPSSLLGLLLRDETIRRLGAWRANKLFAEGLVSKKTGDACQGFQVLAGGALRPHHR